MDIFDKMFIMKIPQKDITLKTGHYLGALLVFLIAKQGDTML